MIQDTLLAIPTTELNILKWLGGALGILGSMVITLLAWSFNRELKRVDDERQADTSRLEREHTANIARLEQRIELEVRHRDTTIAGLDSDLLGVRSKVHDLGNQVSGHHGIIEGMGDNIKSMEASTDNLANVVTDLRIAVVRFQAIMEANDRRSHERRES